MLYDLPDTDRETILEALDDWLTYVSIREAAADLDRARKLAYSARRALSPPAVPDPDRRSGVPGRRSTDAEAVTRIRERQEATERQASEEAREAGRDPKTGGVLDAADDLLDAADRFDRAEGDGRR